MTLAAWGLILDIVGVLIIAAATFEMGKDKKGCMVMNSLPPGKLVPRSESAVLVVSAA